MAIRFYATGDEFGDFSNFSAHPFELDGHTWPTSEHYFQAQKFAEPHVQKRIRQARSPMVAARLGRDRDLPLRRDWEGVKDDVMRRAVRAKFAAHASLRDLLLSTGDQELIEATTSDHYWGCGSGGNGRNMLGKILMEVRRDLKKGKAAAGG